MAFISGKGIKKNGNQIEREMWKSTSFFLNRYIDFRV